MCMRFFRQECWSELPFPPPGNFPDPGTEPVSPALWADSAPAEPSGKLFSRLGPHSTKSPSLQEVSILVEHLKTPAFPSKHHGELDSPNHHCVIHGQRENASVPKMPCPPAHRRWKPHSVPLPLLPASKHRVFPHQARTTCYEFSHSLIFLLSYPHPTCIHFFIFLLSLSGCVGQICVNLTGLQDAQTFGQKLLWVCL